MAATALEFERISRKYEEIATSTASGTWHWDLVTDKFDIDKYVKILLGFEDDVISSETRIWEVFIHPEDRIKIINEINHSVYGSSDEFKCVHRLKSSSGAFVTVCATGKIRRDGYGKAFMISGVLTEVSKKMKVIDDLTKGLRHFNGLVSSMDEVFIELSTDLRILKWNNAFKSTFDKSASEILGVKIESIISKSGNPDFYSSLENLYQHSDASIIPVAVDNEKSLAVKVHFADDVIFVLGVPKKKDELYSAKVQDHDLRGISILYADDLKSNLVLMKGQCSHWGINVDLANSGMEAVEIAQRQTYDLILLDIQMPDIDGYNAANRIRKNDDNIPIIAYTAETDRNLYKRIKRAGMGGVIYKPATTGEIIEKISYYIKNSKRGSSNNAANDSFEMPGSKELDTVFSGDPLGYINLIDLMIKEITETKRWIFESIEQRNLQRLSNGINSLKSTLESYNFHDFMELMTEVRATIRKDETPSEEAILVTHKCFDDVLMFLIKKTETLKAHSLK